VYVVGNAHPFVHGLTSSTVTNQETMVQNKSDGRPPDLKGFLSKWKTRWFVLENGVLSYCEWRQK
jgi:hypothetical protein